MAEAKSNRYVRVAHEVACGYCGLMFVSRDKRRGHCYEIACSRAHKAKQARDQWWSAKHRAKHGRKPERFDIVCDGCKLPAVVASRDSRFCTLSCWSRYENGKGQGLEIYRRPRVWLGGEVPSGAGFVSGPCGWCGEGFVARKGAVYCSTRCSANAQWKRRYDRRGEFSISRKVRLMIYARDKMTCQLCSLPVDLSIPTQDRMGHTLDHIVPQSAGPAPDHSPANLRLAHRVCNSVRGAARGEVGYGSTSSALPELGCLQEASAQ